MDASKNKLKTQMKDPIKPPRKMEASKNTAKSETEKKDSLKPKKQMETSGNRVEEDIKAFFEPHEAMDMFFSSLNKSEKEQQEVFKEILNLFPDRDKGSKH